MFLSENVYFSEKYWIQDKCGSACVAWGRAFLVGCF